MKKRICALLAAMLLTGAAASADGLDFLKPIWMQMMDGGDSAEASIPQDVRVTCADERLTVEKYGVILENEHAAEAHIYAVLRNVSGKRLPIQTVQMKAVGANGKALHEERYVSHLPDVIEPGETMIVSEWMYDFTKDIGKVSGIEITVETSTRAYTRWTRLDGVRAWREGQYLCVELANTTEETLYGAVMQSAYATEDMGLLPGSSVIWRKRLEDSATLEIGTGELTCEAWAYRIEEI